MMESWECVTLDAGNGVCVTVRCRPAGPLEIPTESHASADSTGLELWSRAAETLAKFLTAHSWLVRNRRVVELGSGTGAVGLVAACLEPREVCLTDGSPLTLQLLQRNAKEAFPSHTPCPLSVRALEWGSDTTNPQHGCGTFDMVLGSDVIFACTSATQLLHTASRLLDHSSEALFLVSHQERRAVFLDPLGVVQQEQEDSALQAFLNAALHEGLHVRTWEAQKSNDGEEQIVLLALAWEKSALDAWDCGHENPCGEASSP